MLVRVHVLVLLVLVKTTLRTPLVVSSQAVSSASADPLWDGGGEVLGTMETATLLSRPSVRINGRERAKKLFPLHNRLVARPKERLTRKNKTLQPTPLLLLLLRLPQ